MLRLVRLALLAVLCLVVLALVVAIGRPETGPVEDVVMVGMILGLFALTVPIHRIGTASP